MTTRRDSRVPVALSTASVYPQSTTTAFEIASRLGYDGLEVMISTDAVSQDIEAMRRLSDHYEIPILAIHAPCLLLTQRVWGRDPWLKLSRTREAAEALGASTVVVHPPFRWQRDYARDFADGLKRMQGETDVVFAVENMYPLRAGVRDLVLYAPDWSVVDQDYSYVTLDLSHTSVSGSDALQMADELGDRVAHVHLADGSGLPNRDEHLVPGRGQEPCAELIDWLVDRDYHGMIVCEINTRRAESDVERDEDLAAALRFARKHLETAATGAGTGKRSV
jgi:sugar phosphate isomerase/epimerase